MSPSLEAPRLTRVARLARVAIAVHGRAPSGAALGLMEECPPWCTVHRCDSSSDHVPWLHGGCKPGCATTGPQRSATPCVTGTTRTRASPTWTRSEPEAIV